MTNPLAEFNALCCALSTRLMAGDAYDDEIADGFRDEMDWPWRLLGRTNEQWKACRDGLLIDDALFGNTVE